MEAESESLKCFVAPGSGTRLRKAAGHDVHALQGLVSW